MLGMKEATTEGSAWRSISINNIPRLVAVANKIHPDLPESDHVFAERVKLFPSGCLALMSGESDELYGYVISHPIRRRQPPALNSLLGQIAPDANQYYIHDLVLLPEVRGRGFAQECISTLFAVAERCGYATTCLVSVYGTAPFWGQFGFVEPEEMDEGLKKKVRGYGDDATYLECVNDSKMREKWLTDLRMMVPAVTWSSFAR